MTSFTMGGKRLTIINNDICLDYGHDGEIWISIPREMQDIGRGVIFEAWAVSIDWGRETAKQAVSEYLDLYPGLLNEISTT